MSAEPPCFIVGCPRSGTTLLRTILDGHPDLAIPDESHFVVGLAPGVGRRRTSLDDILAHPRVRAWDVDPDTLRAGVRHRPHDSYADLVDAVFASYAEAHGKRRWGDKTPGYVTHLPRLGRLFPEARFVHVIRDGREVAASLAELPWGSRSAVNGAYWWVHKVRAGRRAGHRLGTRYTELRLEDLVADPAGEVRRLCDFLALDYDASVLEYPVKVAAGGARPRQERHLVRPPTAGLRDWRAGLGAPQARAVEEVCRRTLEDLGYDAPPRSRTAAMRARAIRGRDLARTAAPAVAARLRPARRSY